MSLADAHGKHRAMTLASLREVSVGALGYPAGTSHGLPAGAAHSSGARSTSADSTDQSACSP